MKKSTNIVKILSNSSVHKRYKWPKLAELYYELFRKKYDEEDAHNAAFDTKKTYECYFRLV